MVNPVSQVQTIIISAEDAQQRLDRFLRRQHPFLTQGWIEQKLRKGEARVNGKKVDASYRIKTGDALRLPPFPDDQTIQPIRPKALSPHMEKDLRKAIFFEDEHIIALNKQSGWAVQGGGKLTSYLDAQLRQLYDGHCEPRLVHRLDKETSGVLVMAKTRQAAEWLGNAFKNRQVDKTYLALVYGVPFPLEATIKAPLLRHTRGNYAHVEVDANGKPASTDYAVIDHAGKAFSLLKLHPQTGRTHQIRVHCQYMKTSIVGDGKYGSTEAASVEELSELWPEELTWRLYLHAYELTLPAWGKRPAQTLTAPLDHEWQKTLKGLGLNAQIDK